MIGPVTGSGGTKRQYIMMAAVVITAMTLSSYNLYTNLAVFIKA